MTILKKLNNLFVAVVFILIGTCFYLVNDLFARDEAINTSSTYQYIKLFYITSKTPLKKMFCTATFLKINYQCKLVTNYHCVANSLNINLYYQEKNLERSSQTYNKDHYGHYFVSNTKNDPIKVSIKKIKPGHDLAELEVPEEINKNFCNLINNTIYFKEKNEIMSMTGRVALGYVNGKPKEQYSRNMNWNKRRQYGDSTIKSSLFTSDNKGGTNHFLFFNELTIHPGMSGGVLMKLGSSTPQGLISQFIPFQNKIFIIPIDSVINFLDYHSENHQRNIKNFSYFRPTSIRPETSFAAHITIPYTEKLPDDSSGNFSVKNEHAGGGDIKTDKEDLSKNNLYKIDSRFSTKKKIMNLLGGVNEGIINPSNKDNIILGFQTIETNCLICNEKYFHQINGNNDYQFKFIDDFYLRHNFKNQKISKIIGRSKNGKIQNKKILKNIISRLKGNYSISSRGDQNSERAIPFNQNHHVLEKNENSPKGWNTILNGNISTNLKIDSDLNKILFRVEEHFLNFTGLIKGCHILNESLYQFKIRYSDSGDYVFLENLKSPRKISCISSTNGSRINFSIPARSKLICDNNNFLKLNCSNDNMVLSLSLNNTSEKRILTYRFAIYSNLNEKEAYFHYYFGNIGHEAF